MTIVDNNIRQRMKPFVDAQESEDELKELRSGVESMSELVEDGRSERI